MLNFAGLTLNERFSIILLAVVIQIDGRRILNVIYEKIEDVIVCLVNFCILNPKFHHFALLSRNFIHKLS